MRRINLILCFLTAIFTLAILSANAQMMLPTQAPAEEAVVLPDQLTKENVRDLVSKLSDQQVRDLLLKRLDAVAEKEALDPENNITFFDYINLAFFDVGNSVIGAVQTIPKMFNGLGRGLHMIGERQGLMGVLKFFGGLILIVAVGLGFGQLIIVLTRSTRERLATTQSNTLGATIRILAVRLFLDLLKIIVFAITSFAMTRFLHGNEPIFGLTWGVIFSLIIPTMVMASLARFLFAPTRSELRLLNMEDVDAKRLYKHSIISGFIIGCFIFFQGAWNAMHIEVGEYKVGFWLNLIIHAFFIYSLYKSRTGIAQALIGKDGLVGASGVRLAKMWPWIAIALTVLSWIVVEAIAGAGRFDLLSGGENYWTLLLIAFVPAFDTALRGLVNRLTPPPIGEGLIAERAHIATLSSFVRAGRVILVGIILMLGAMIWDFSLLDTDSVNSGTRIASTILDGLFAFIIGYLIWELVGLVINRRLAREHGDAGIDMEADEPGGGEGGGTGLSRLATILPMVKLSLQSTILAMTVLLGLSRLGVDTTPLLAGAGIVGLAIGFGAQTLVKDIVSGVFFLADDAFRVGEYLVIGTTVGTVERISIRSLQLRHHQGPIHTIPYGEIPQVTNNSRDWVIMKMKFTFPFETDANKIKKIFKKVGAEILETEYAGDLIQTFKSQGVYDVDDVGIVIRGKFMAKPGTQWIIRKDVYNRVQKALDEAGIQFARKEVRVQIPDMAGSAPLTEDQKQAIGAAASEAAQKPVEPAK